MSPAQFLESSNSRWYHWILKLLKSEVWEQNCEWFFYYISFERNYDVLKSKRTCILLKKNINFIKNEIELKMKIPRAVLERLLLWFSSYKNCKSKITRKRKFGPDVPISLKNPQSQQAASTQNLWWLILAKIWQF